MKWDRKKENRTERGQERKGKREKERQGWKENRINVKANENSYAICFVANGTLYIVSAYKCTDIAKKNIILVGIEGLLSLAQQIKTF